MTTRSTLPGPAPAETITRIFTLLTERGGGGYFGEPVTQLEHMLQTAQLAREAGAAPALVAAALLHDVGHLAHDEGEDAAERGIDTRHEALGAELLTAAGFGPGVTRVIAEHVNAKRYLAAILPRYMSGLSAASVTSLGLQGGPMTPDEAGAWLARPGAREAVSLRRWDEQAKVAGADVPGLASYRPLLAQLLAGAS